MRKENQLDSVLKASFLGIFLFAFLILPIGCNKTSIPENTNIEPQETAKVVENAPESNKKEIVLLTSNDNWNLVLGVRNNSSANNPMDLKAYIDGKLFMDQSVEYTIHRPGAGFYFKLDEGEHMLKVETKNSNAILNQPFKITGRHYAQLDYFNNPGGTDEFSGEHFSFAIQDRPFIGF